MRSSREICSSSTKVSSDESLGTQQRQAWPKQGVEGVCAAKMLYSVSTSLGHELHHELIIYILYIQNIHLRSTIRSTVPWYSTNDATTPMPTTAQQRSQIEIQPVEEVLRHSAHSLDSIVVVSQLIAISGSSTILSNS